jgi:hypothetical protein
MERLEGGGGGLTQKGVYWIVSSVVKKWKPGRGSGFVFVTVKKRRPVYAHKIIKSSRKESEQRRMPTFQDRDQPVRVCQGV